jgi:hypothetical protein
MTTGNPERDKRLVRAIRECIACNEDPKQIGLVAEHLPKDFDLSDDELAEALHELKRTPAATLTPAVAAEPDAAPADSDHGQATSPQDSTPVKEAKLTLPQARAAVERAHKRLGEARVAVQIARQKLVDTKGKLALAITAWQSNSEPGTPEERRMREVRAHLASEAARKQRLRDAGVQPNRMRTDKFPAVNLETGQMGSKGNSRGAYPAAYEHRNVKNPGMFHGK